MLEFSSIYLSWNKNVLFWSNKSKKSNWQSNNVNNASINCKYSINKTNDQSNSSQKLNPLLIDYEPNTLSQDPC
uniref:GM09210p n=1 Tax=Drosophila melanogaster TaxID=7227 RepID=Q95S47_DROME|nr:GM09210p [Drosophila melanogaster]